MAAKRKPVHQYAAQVMRVIDGDTLDVEIDLGFRLTDRTPLRVAHCNAPEHGTKTGDAATAWAAGRLGPLPAAVIVRTFKPQDKYGRYLAEVQLADGTDLASELIANGHAVPYEGGAR